MIQQELQAYQAKDFTLQRNPQDSRNPYGFTTKCRCRKPWVSANFFWQPDNVTLRIIGDAIPCMEIAFPFVNHRGQGTLLDPKDVLATLLRRLNNP